MEVNDGWITAEAKKTIIDFGVSVTNYGNSAGTVDGITTCY